MLAAPAPLTSTVTPPAEPPTWTERSIESREPPREPSEPSKPAARHTPGKLAEPQAGASRAHSRAQRTPDIDDAENQDLAADDAGDTTRWRSQPGFASQFLADDTAFLLSGSANVNGIEIHVDRGIWMNRDTVDIRMHIHNSTRIPYYIAAVTLYDQHERTYVLAVKPVQSTTYASRAVAVAAGEETRLALRVQRADRLIGQVVALEVSEHGGDRRLRIEGIQWPSQ
jgi:hypothetical protein